RLGLGTQGLWMFAAVACCCMILCALIAYATHTTASPPVKHEPKHLSVRILRWEINSRDAFLAITLIGVGAFGFSFAFNRELLNQQPVSLFVFLAGSGAFTGAGSFAPLQLLGIGATLGLLITLGMLLVILPTRV